MVRSDTQTNKQAIDNLLMWDSLRFTPIIIHVQIGRYCIDGNIRVEFIFAVKVRPRKFDLRSFNSLENNYSSQTFTYYCIAGNFRVEFIFAYFCG